MGRLDDIKATKSPLGAKMSIKEADYNLLMDLAKASIKLTAELEKLQRELVRMESSNNSLNADNKELKLKNKNLTSKVSHISKQAKCLNKAIKEHPDSEEIFINAKEKFSPSKSIQAKPKEEKKSTKQKGWDLDR